MTSDKRQEISDKLEMTGDGLQVTGVLERVLERGLARVLAMVLTRVLARVLTKDQVRILVLAEYLRYVLPNTLATPVNWGTFSGQRIFHS